MHLPPPIFSKVDMPQNYRFLPNLLFRVVEEKGPDGEVPPRPGPASFLSRLRGPSLLWMGEREREYPLTPRILGIHSLSLDQVTKKFERALRRQPATSFRLPAVAFDEGASCRVLCGVVRVSCIRRHDTTRAALWVSDASEG